VDSYKEDRTGLKALEKVLGRPITEVEPEWEKWVLTLSFGGIRHGKPMIGVKFDRRFAEGGALVNELIKNTPASRAGMKEGDIVIAMDGEKVEDYDGLIKLLKKKKRGDKAEFKIKRGSEELTLTLRLGYYPEEDTKKKPEEKKEKTEDKPEKKDDSEEKKWH
jgi:S1-C subfamily serine protease